MLWTKQQNFESGTNFRAWAFAVARFEVLAHLKKQKREGIVLLDEFAARVGRSVSACRKPVRIQTTPLPSSDNVAVSKLPDERR